MLSIFLIQSLLKSFKTVVPFWLLKKCSLVTKHSWQKQKAEDLSRPGLYTRVVHIAVLMCSLAVSHSVYSFFSLKRKCILFFPLPLQSVIFFNKQLLSVYNLVWWRIQIFVICCVSCCIGHLLIFFPFHLLIYLLSYVFFFLVPYNLPILCLSSPVFFLLWVLGFFRKVSLLFLWHWDYWHSSCWLYCIVFHPFTFNLSLSLHLKSLTLKFLVDV